MTVPGEVLCDVEWSSQQLIRIVSRLSVPRENKTKWENVELFLRVGHYKPAGTSKNQVACESDVNVRYAVIALPGTIIGGKGGGGVKWDIKEKR